MELPKRPPDELDAAGVAVPTDDPNALDGCDAERPPEEPGFAGVCKPLLLPPPKREPPVSLLPPANKEAPGLLVAGVPKLNVGVGDAAGLFPPNKFGDDPATPPPKTFPDAEPVVLSVVDDPKSGLF